MTNKRPVGGRRDYQPGRPPKAPGEKHVSIGFSVPPDVAEWLKTLDRRSEWLTETVRKEPALLRLVRAVEAVYEEWDSGRTYDAVAWQDMVDMRDRELRAALKAVRSSVRSDSAETAPNVPEAPGSAGK